MIRQPNRIETAPGHALAGLAIDRTRPIRFRLNGYAIDGFAGDTVLSAALASGIIGVGTHEGHPIALSERFAPAVAPSSLVRDRQQALPMDRAPACDGLELRTIPTGTWSKRPRATMERLLRGYPRSLGIPVDTGTALPRPWLDIPASQTLTADIIVVGGGIAGMTAAAVAARRGASVILLERRPSLGGNAVLFGRTEDQEGPEEAIQRLGAELARSESVTILTATDAFALDGTRLRAHRVTTLNGAPHGEVIALEAPRLVLATGATERLPIFPGNRLPGIAGTAEAFHLAHAYGVWPGRISTFSTVCNASYRLAMLAADAGITVRRILDHRPRPQSRFLEFCKAYGITMAGGMLPLAAATDPRRDELTLSLAVSLEDYVREEAPVTTERLVVNGGWQPDLLLWHLGGGRSVWRADRNCIGAATGPEHIALAGAAASYLSTNACMESGRDAVDCLFGRTRRDVRETIIDEIYETPDGATPITRGEPLSILPAYLDDGISLTVRPVPPAPGLLEKLRLRPAADDWHLAEQPRALSIADVAAGVDLGTIPPAGAGLVAQERATGSGDLVDSARQAEAPPAPTQEPALVPDYLRGRFGSAATVWRIASSEQRRLDTGSLIFINSDQTNPLNAMGVVLRPIPGETGAALALIGKLGAHPGEGATLRDQNRAVPIRLMAPHHEAEPTLSETA